jgi:hypothetical protein
METNAQTIAAFSPPPCPFDLLISTFAKRSGAIVVSFSYHLKMMENEHG